MEEFDKNLNENEINAEGNRENENTAEEISVSEPESASEPTAAPASEILTEPELPISAEPTELTSEDDANGRPIYRWNYEEQRDFINGETRKKHKNGAVIYAVVMTCAFLVSFAILAALLIMNGLGMKITSGSESPSPSGGTEAERIVYVREYDPESGILTTQEIYDKCLPAIVTVSVSNDTAAGVGSGFIISEDGYIVTANHVVDGMTSVSVILSDGAKYAAVVVDGNAFTDLALLKINASELPTIAIGKSSDLLVGDHVVAIGTPASVDFSGSLSDGTISHNNRLFKIYDDNGSVEKKMMLIQTNALVNPGNSGCPLINEYGEAVGIVTMKLNSSYYEGMCFAIPTDTAMPIINAMRNGENYDELLFAVSKYPAKLGVTVENATTASNVPGVKITSFSSSEYDISQKMKVGDIITKVGSETVTSIADMSYELDKYEPGDTVRITFYRNTQLLAVDVILGR